jgi:hypothetical protein
MQQEDQAADAVEKSIDHLDESLESLGPDEE